MRRESLEQVRDFIPDLDARISEGGAESPDGSKLSALSSSSVRSRDTSYSSPNSSKKASKYRADNRPSPLQHSGPPSRPPSSVTTPTSNNNPQRLPRNVEDIIQRTLKKTEAGNITMDELQLSGLSALLGTLNKTMECLNHDVEDKRAPMSRQPSSSSLSSPPSTTRAASNGQPHQLLPAVPCSPPANPDTIHLPMQAPEDVTLRRLSKRSSDPEHSFHDGIRGEERNTERDESTVTATSESDDTLYLYSEGDNRFGGDMTEGSYTQGSNSSTGPPSSIPTNDDYANRQLQLHENATVLEMNVDDYKVGDIVEAKNAGEWKQAIITSIEGPRQIRVEFLDPEMERALVPVPVPVENSPPRTHTSSSCTVEGLDLQLEQNPSYGPRTPVLPRPQQDLHHGRLARAPSLPQKRLGIGNVDFTDVLTPSGTNVKSPVDMYERRSVTESEGYSSTGSARPSTLASNKSGNGEPVAHMNKHPKPAVPAMEAGRPNHLMPRRPSPRAVNTIMYSPPAPRLGPTMPQHPNHLGVTITPPPLETLSVPMEGSQPLFSPDLRSHEIDPEQMLHLIEEIQDGANTILTPRVSDNTTSGDDKRRHYPSERQSSDTTQHSRDTPREDTPHSFSDEAPRSYRSHRTSQPNSRTPTPPNSRTSVPSSSDNSRPSSNRHRSGSPRRSLRESVPAAKKSLLSIPNRKKKSSDYAPPNVFNSARVTEITGSGRVSPIGDSIYGGNKAGGASLDSMLGAMPRSPTMKGRSPGGTR